jgi:iron complex outermembrane recepter protein
MQLFRAVPFVLFTVLPLAAQQAPVPRDTTARDTLESVVVRAVRAGTAVPTSQTILDREAIERSYVGQDAPLALLGVTGVTASSDAGAFSGYSSIRLRGIDQSRLAVSVDGVPLNDPEDQVLYFSNVPDFMNSMHSVRVQRGVGSSAFGTASFAGSLDFESMPLLTTPRFAEGQFTGGSWGTQRVSVEGASGLVKGFAAYGRVSAQETEGYRIRSGNEAYSGFVSAGWFGERDVLKFTGFAGRSELQSAYLAASADSLRVNRRSNPMSPDERDDFRQEMASLQYTRALRPGVTVTTTAYRNSAGGWFDVEVGDPDLWRFGLDHVWYGLLSTVTWDGDGFSMAAGAHASTYSRDHFLNIKPDLQNRTYDNTGFKQEQSAFVKGTITRGIVDWHGDVQVRRAAFRYRPSAGTSFAEPRVDWLFVNPKIGVTLRARPTLEFFAAAGQAGREPARLDMFAGEDDLTDDLAADLLPLTRVNPERLTNVEVGSRWRRGTLELSANAFGMWFRNEIARIGELTVTGSQRRDNVGRTSRVGLEGEARWQARPSLMLAANGMVMHARIEAYTNQRSGLTFRDVPPVMSPAVLANIQAAWTPLPALELSLLARHMGEAHLTNEGRREFMLPASTLADVGGSYTMGRTTLRVQVQNLLNADAYSDGSVRSGRRFLFPWAERTVLATMAIRW